MRALIENFQKDIEEIKTHQGILPICTSCKKIRDGKGHWNHIKANIREHYQAEYTDCICPKREKKNHLGYFQ